jgi:hypothetical protein
MNTQKIMTEWGELSIVYRKGYYYAIKQMRGQKRQIYLGKTIPSQERLEEIAEELNLPPDKWINRHSKKVKQVENSSLDSIIDTLNKIGELAKARGEIDIARLINNTTRDLIKLSTEKQKDE